MRDIKFRGKRIDNGDWCCGSLIQMIDPAKEDDIYDRAFIHGGVSISPLIQVIPQSVGQFTGLKDKNGIDIYEGDILYMWNTGIGKAIVRFHIGTFAFFTEKDKYLSPITPCYWKDAEIIGNIFDNPELITL